MLAGIPHPTLPVVVDAFHYQLVELLELMPGAELRPAGPGLVAACLDGEVPVAAVTWGRLPAAR